MMQAAVVDSQALLFGLPSTNLSFIVPMLCFCVVAVYCHHGCVRHSIANHLYA